MKLTKTFFKQNPLPEQNLAEEIMLGCIEDISCSTFDFAQKNIEMYRRYDSKRAERMSVELELIKKAQTADDFINILRKHNDFSLADTLALTVAKYEDTVLPELVKLYSRSLNDDVLDSIALIIFNADIKYVEELFDNYSSIRSPYAQAIACLMFVFVYEADDELEEFYLKEYNRFKSNYPDSFYSEFPLYALYWIHDLIEWKE